MMNKIILLSAFLLAGCLPSIAQTATIRGIIKDGQTKEALTGASVSISPQYATITDASGKYELKVPAGPSKLSFAFIGLQTETQAINVAAGETKVINVTLKSTDQELGTVMVTVGKISKRIQKESMSIEVFKPRILETNNITNVLQAVNKVPGVTTLDGSISIRGGSGYAYGSGSRVMMVVDDIPLVTPDRGEIKWEFVPLENVAQVEILKGASSVQYGSGALNGVISVNSSNPKDTPATKITLYHEIVCAPPTAAYKWWGKENNLSYFEGPHTNGLSFSHSRKIANDVQLTIGLNLHEFQSHLKEEIENRVRFNWKVKYVPHKFNRLTLGFSGNVMTRKSAFQFYWQDKEHPYLGASGVTIRENYLYTILDPSIAYVDRWSSQHRFLFRWFNQKSLNNKQGRPAFSSYWTDYQFRHDFVKSKKVNAKLLIGANNLHFTMEDNTLGIHKGDQGGAYIQTEVGFKGLTINLGGRFEFLHLDSTTKIAKPVFSVGLNYEFKKYNFFRASFGQAYRYGSIAERFVLYQLGNINIEPNPGLLPESGFTAEVGYKRMLGFGKNWRGFFDVSVFGTEFKNMIEFSLTRVDFKPDGSYNAFFQSQNVTRARLFGWEFNLAGEGKIGPVDLTLQGGYTYFYPRDMTDTTRHNDLKTFFKDAFQSYYKPTEDQQRYMLRYRIRHNFKFDIDALLYKKVRIGTVVNYYSYMDGIDFVFTVAVPGLKEYRKQTYNKGDWVWDVRLGYDITKNLSINVIGKNILNRDYAIRIAKPNAPRSFNIQLMAKF